MLLLFLQEDRGLECLQTVATVMRDSDVSPFEVIHAGLIRALLLYLTAQTGAVDREVRLRRFLHVFLHCPVRHLTKPLSDAQPQS